MHFTNNDETTQLPLLLLNVIFEVEGFRTRNMQFEHTVDSTNTDATMKTTHHDASGDGLTCSKWQFAQLNCNIDLQDASHALCNVTLLTAMSTTVVCCPSVLQFVCVDAVSKLFVFIFVFVFHLVSSGTSPSPPPPTLRPPPPASNTDLYDCMHEKLEADLWVGGMSR